MKIIVGCECSNTVSGAFREAGHIAWSCDLKPTEGPEQWHHQGDIVAFLKRHTADLIVLHPDCTAMAVCGNRHYANTPAREDAVKWTVQLARLARAQGKRVCIENPASVIFPHLRKLGFDVQYVQPWQFGHPETKKTGLALWNLPRLEETQNCYDEMMKLPKKDRHRIWYMSPSEDRQ